MGSPPPTGQGWGRGHCRPPDALPNATRRDSDEARKRTTELQRTPSQDTQRKEERELEEGRVRQLVPCPLLHFSLFCLLCVLSSVSSVTLWFVASSVRGAGGRREVFGGFEEVPAVGRRRLERGGGAAARRRRLVGEHQLDDRRRRHRPGQFPQLVHHPGQRQLVRR